MCTAHAPVCPFLILQARGPARVTQSHYACDVKIRQDHKGPDLRDYRTISDRPIVNLAKARIHFHIFKAEVTNRESAPRLHYSFLLHALSGVNRPS